MGGENLPQSLCGTIYLFFHLSHVNILRSVPNYMATAVRPKTELPLNRWT